MNTATRSHGPHSNVGQSGLLGIEAADNLALAKRVERGLPYSTFERVERASGLSQETLREAVRIAPRTLARRKHEKRLSPEESDRLVSISRLLALAADLFEGNVEQSLAWLRFPHRALNGLTPISVASTTVGLREVEALIGRLEHGVIT